MKTTFWIGLLFIIGISGRTAWACDQQVKGQAAGRASADQPNGAPSGSGGVRNVAVNSGGSQRANVLDDGVFTNVGRPPAPATEAWSSAITK